MIKYLLILFVGALFSNQVILPFNNNSVVIYKGSHPAHNWEGVNSNIKGGIICEKEECIIQVIVPLESFDSGSSGRDSNMLFSTESHKYPYVKYYSDSFLMRSIKKQGSIELSGYMEFHGITKRITTQISINYQDSILFGKTSFSISLDDYEVERPQLLFVPISDQINLECSLYCDNIFSKLK